ncbi:hypothetical protein QE364_003501 [Nocardioides zeae]|uniref:Uncharacterized protein n=2 Tax=Nocardioides zeae TaxID=1457234 RepID=A0ACC6IM81_9ACTN|nr:PRC-barrel domain-containing protein [Nocardioides zeae]MDQ1103053.1 hypothetical protein [Nocardioides zeae]MDR6173226.1 hypothetical protein [Nocardioides zeae]MDR6211773.1 hypothetical protein [Nocardioides zeae]
MLDETQARDAIGTTAYTQAGDKIGKVGQLYYDDATGQPAFVTVNTGLFGMRESFVPVTDATLDGDRLTLPFTKEQIKDAPSVDVDGGHLDEAEEARLWQHYAGHRGRHVGPDTNGRTTDEATTRPAENAGVGTATPQAGRPRLRRYVTTELVTQTVPVRRERIEVVDDADGVDQVDDRRA